MRPTADEPGGTTGAGSGTAPWQPPLEADAADAAEQTRGLADDDGGGDPEVPVAAPGAGRPAGDLLDRASEADLAEQLSEVSYDEDDGDR